MPHTHSVYRYDSDIVCLLRLLLCQVKHKIVDDELKINGTMSKLIIQE